MNSSVIIELVGLGIIAGILLWMLRRQSSLIISVTRLESKVDFIGEMRNDIKDHEKRVTILEPKCEAAHRRMDELSQH